ncbi:hypothetical protein GCM10027021_14170 [Dyella kyungheensis]
MFIHIYSIAVLFLPVLALWALGFGVRALRTVVIQLRGLHTSRRDVLDGVTRFWQPTVRGARSR